ncbi:hypothetical protein [Microbacterium sp.]|uniref:hypothetical protein n=1 Tax=Microbacterium sp. TaxID=51671 RepID=UPI003F9ACF06
MTGGFSRAYRGKWLPAMIAAHEFVDKSVLPVTLRQTFYSLVSRQLLENTETNYRKLSENTAAERRAGSFPAFVDNGREIHRAYADVSPSATLTAAAKYYRLDRSIGQPFQVWMLAEKRGMTSAMRASFEKYGVRIIGLGGYASQTLLDDVRREIVRDGRPAIGIYGGDFDATGQDIPRHFQDGTGSWVEWVQVALTADQVEEYNLPENPGKTTDTRSAAFAERHGRLVQVEIDALEPLVLDQLYRDAFDQFTDKSAFEDVLDREADERQQMLDFIGTFQGGAA